MPPPPLSRTTKVHGSSGRFTKPDTSCRNARSPNSANVRRPRRESERGGDHAIDPVGPMIEQDRGRRPQSGREPLQVTHGHRGRRHDARPDTGGMAGEDAGHHRLGQLGTERVVDGGFGGGLHRLPPWEPLRIADGGATPDRLEPGVSIDPVEFGHHVRGIDPLPPRVDRHHLGPLFRRALDVPGQRLGEPGRAEEHHEPRLRAARSARWRRLPRPSPPPATGAGIARTGQPKRRPASTRPRGAGVAPPPAMMTPRPTGEVESEPTGGCGRADQGRARAGRQHTGLTDQRIPEGQIEMDGPRAPRDLPLPRRRRARPAVARKTPVRPRALPVHSPTGWTW